MQLGGKVALVTGAGSEIARARALMMAREGAKIVAVGRGRVELDRVVREIELEGGHAIVAEADVADSEAVRAFGVWGATDTVGDSRAARFR